MPLLRVELETVKSRSEMIEIPLKKSVSVIEGVRLIGRGKGSENRESGGKGSENRKKKNARESAVLPNDAGSGRSALKKSVPFLKG